MWLCFFLGIIGELFYEARKSQIREQNLNDYEYNGDKLSGGDFGESAQLYYR